MQDTLVAINVIYDDKIINPNNVPLLYYNNGDKTVLDSLKEDDSFKDFICKLIYDKEGAYSKTTVAYFYFKDNNGKDEYADNVVSLQDFMSISDLTKKNNIWGIFVKKHFDYLYECAYKTNYKFSDDITKDIFDIYKAIQKKYPEKIMKDTVINYIRGELIKTDCIDTNNTDWVVDKLQEILKDYE